MGRAVKNKLLNLAVSPGVQQAAALAVQNMLGGSATTTNTTTRKKAIGTTSLPKGRRIKHKPKKVRAVNSKLPKGLSKKLHSKITKSVNFTKNWGVYTSTSCAQLRQTTRDQRTLIFNDKNSIPFMFASPFELMHFASVLFNQKTDDDTWTITTGNFDDRIKINVTNYYVTFFFKSTSSHVVNIEMFECTARDDYLQTTVDAENFINNSYGNFQNTYTTPSTSGACAATDLNASPSEWLELYRQFYVKKRVFKLQPGDFTTATIKIMGNRTVDFSKCSENGTLLGIKKFLTKQVFFRVLNDPTVSTTSNATPTAGVNAGDVHHWPSNAIGGVALTYTKHFRMAALPNPQASNTAHAMANSIKRSNWLPTVSDALDQQVVYQNPISTATGGL